jgi:serine/threonine-protein kinase
MSLSGKIWQSFKSLKADYKIQLAVALIALIGTTPAWLSIPGIKETLQSLVSPQKSQVEKGKTYNKDIDGIKISINYPKTWKRQDIDNTFTGDVVTFIPPEENTSNTCKESLTINFENLVKPLSLDEYTNLAIKEIEQNNLKGNISKPEEVTFANYRANKINYTTSSGKCNLKFMQVLSIKNNKACYITYTAEASEYSKYLNTVEEMIDSFQISY